MKIVSINIEDRKHIAKVTELIANEKPDILFVQEICEANLADFTALMGGAYTFAAMAFKDNLGDKVGVATFTSLPATHNIHLLKESEKAVTAYSAASFEDRFRSQNYYALETTVTDDEGQTFRFYNVHLPVTKEGTTSDFQLATVEALLRTLELQPDSIVVGDSNAPRGGEAFAKLAAHYKDNIPEHYTTSIDGEIHRAGPLERMVDVLFTTPHYIANKVTFISGVSDHYALKAEVSKV